MTTGAPLRSRDRTQPRSARFRTDIQALRALAIAAVVVNHLWHDRLPGGYIGVDVFFVISGFLITSHLFGEVVRTGRVRLGAFYARRVRRLLPAALLVLLVSAIVVALFLPYPRWERNALEIAASASYIENWVLAAMSVNYSALNDSATVAQHYWSLSVEEQFYLVWPIVMVSAVLLGARFAARSSLRRRVLAALVTIGALSFLASIWFTAISPNQAYFVTFTRAWEFALGGLVALLAHRFRPGRVLTNLLTAAGLIAVVASAVVFNEQTPFPGVAALVPVVGTAVIIAAGGNVRQWHTWFTASAPVQWLGGVSYSLYLWHWPLIVIAPFALSAQRSTVMNLGILAVAVVLAWLTKIAVEDPGQRWTFWKTSVRRSMLAMLAGMLVVVLAAAALFIGGRLQAEGDDPDGALPVGGCLGPNALQDDRCADPFGPAESVVMTAKNEYFYTPPECGEFVENLGFPDFPTTHVCDFSGDSEPTDDVWLVGDSHAQHWQGAMFDLARDRGWRLTISYYGGCPAADVAFTGFRTPWGASDVDRCRQWSRDVSDAIASEKPRIVFSSMAARLQFVDDGSGTPEIDQFAEGLARDWTRWANEGVRVVALGDPPFNSEVRDTDCVLLNPEDPVKCAADRAVAQPPDPILLGAELAQSPLVSAIDFTDQFCDTRLCYAVVGGIPVYYDADHLNLQYVRMLAPTIAAAVDAGTPTPPG
ncbi:acyltransferase family protein [uncultured Microbacterium sp.]|uniref:acyltransferase family protein n=1 Tax=uncultured Microbacterium sp. TaxID=191216 RepID=UPI0026314984|nr:acyltransferase family protein [uncultured Microbacterium sp.]